MAINEALPGAEVTITVAGQPLQEYTEADVDEEPKTVTRYVEATSGHVFEVAIKLVANTIFKGECLSFIVRVDGKTVSVPLITPRRRSENVRGVLVPNGLIRLLRFEALESGTSQTAQESRL